MNQFIYFFMLALILNVSPILANSHHPQELLEQIKHAPNAGEQVYQHYCSLCHDQKPQIPLGAPRLGIQSDWIHRDLSDLNAVVKRMDAGLGAMPARGGCFECSDDLLKAAITYIRTH